MHMIGIHIAEVASKFALVFLTPVSCTQSQSYKQNMRLKVITNPIYNGLTMLLSSNKSAKSDFLQASQSGNPIEYVLSNAKMLNCPKNGLNTFPTSSSFLSHTPSSLMPPGPISGLRFGLFDVCMAVDSVCVADTEAAEPSSSDSSSTRATGWKCKGR